MPGTLEVYPLNDYGAVELGQHRFYGVTPGAPDVLRESGRFVHLWRATPEGWRLARVVRTTTGRRTSSATRARR